jgi:hypothetical protein
MNMQWYRIIWNDGHESEIYCSDFEIEVILSRISVNRINLWSVR